MLKRYNDLSDEEFAILKKLRRAINNKVSKQNVK